MRRLTVASGAEERDIVIGNAGLKLPTLPTRGRNRIENLGDTIMTGGRTQIMDEQSRDRALGNLTSVQQLIEDWDLYSEDFKQAISWPLQNALRGISKVVKVLYATKTEKSEPALKMRNDYIEMIDQGQHETEPGLQLRANLVSRLGEQHSVIHNLDRLIRWQKVKRLAKPK